MSNKYVKKISIDKIKITYKDGLGLLNLPEIRKTEIPYLYFFQIRNIHDSYFIQIRIHLLRIYPAPKTERSNRNERKHMKDVKEGGGLNHTNKMTENN